MSDGFLTGTSFGFNHEVDDHPATQGARVGNLLSTAWQKVLLATVVLEIPLLLDRYFLHDADEAKFGAISGFNISLTTICLALLFVHWLPRILVESKGFLISKPLVAFVAISTFTILWAPDKSRTLFGLFLLFQAFLIFIYIVNNIKSQREILFVMTLLVVGFSIQGVMMVLTKATGQDIALGPVAFEILKDSGRSTGSFGSPNVASSYLALFFAPCLGLLFLQVPRMLKILALTAICFSGVALITTLSRGGWLAAAASVVIFVIVAYRKRWLSSFVFAVLAIGVLVLAAGFHQTLAARMFGDDGGSAASRMPLAEISAIMIADNPLGVGENNWDVVGSRHAEQTEYREDWFYVVHNKYLLVLAETGWLGLIAFTAFLGSILWCGWKAVQAPNFILAPLVLGLTAAFAGQILHMSFDIFNSRAQVQMMCLVAALIVATSNLAKQKDHGELPNANPLASTGAVSGA